MQLGGPDRRMTRTGIGLDIHAFDPDRPLVLGGVFIAGSPGLKGHSDADVLTHAIIDALLGAAALGDIGFHFPDTDAGYKDARSVGLLRETARKLRGARHEIENIDASIVAEAPMLAPYIADMRRLIAEAAEIDVQRVSIKATRGEGLGFVGRKEGIAVIAIACITTSI